MIRPLLPDPRRAAWKALAADAVDEHAHADADLPLPLRARIVAAYYTVVGVTVAGRMAEAHSARAELGRLMDEEPL